MPQKLTDTQNPSFALCVSGGGLRATLFHLGFIKALRAYEIEGESALGHVSEIYSVSGGSILAAHLIKNWDKYTGSDEEFAAVEKEIIVFAGCNVRDRVIRRWLLSCLFVLPRLLGRDRGYWLQREYQKKECLGETTFGDCYAMGAATLPPKLHILATSFKTGELCSFSPDQFAVTRRIAANPSACAPGGHLKLSYAVAASSAFPPLFPPLKLTEDMLGNPDSDEFRVPLYLSDGGVFDNLGFEGFRSNPTPRARQPNALIISNAGGSFRSEFGNDYSGTLSRNIRASDIMMRRIAESTEDAARSMPGIAYLDVRIGETVDDGTLPVATQQKLRLVRTDLDRFPPPLAGLLIDHGFRIGTRALAAQGCSASATFQAAALQKQPATADQTVAKAAKRSFLSLALDFSRDWAATSALWAVLIVVLGVTGLIGLSAWNEKQAQDEINENAKKTSLENTSLKVENKNLRSRLPQPVDPPPGTKIATDQYKVWIQFAGSLTRDRMIEFGTTIKAKWRNAPGAERGGERTPNAAGTMEVRHNPFDKAAAEELARDVEATGLVNKMGVKSLDLIPPKSLEIWVSR